MYEWWKEIATISRLTNPSGKFSEINVIANKKSELVATVREMLKHVTVSRSMPDSKTGRATYTVATDAKDPAGFHTFKIGADNPNGAKVWLDSMDIGATPDEIREIFVLMEKKYKEQEAKALIVKNSVNSL
jgi:hypothetical protein